jgi:hypothetical protein
MTDTTTTSRSDNVPPERTLLGRVLLENAAITALLGVLLLVAAARLDGWLGVNAWVLAALGVGLVGYALTLVLWARSAKWVRRGGRLAVAGDGLALAGSGALIAFTNVLTAKGVIALGVVAAIVALFVVLQAVGVAKLDERF